MVTVYVLKGARGKRYTDITNKLSRRLSEHRMKATKAGQLVDDFVVRFTEQFPDYQTAREREIFFKSGQGRKWLDDFEVVSRPA